MDLPKPSHPDLRFDLTAMTEPKTVDDIKALCVEALAELDVVNSALDKLLKE